MRILRYSIIFHLLFICACSNESQPLEADWEASKNYYQENLAQSLTYLDSIRESENPEDAAQFFYDAKAFYKKAEAYAAYLHPESAQRVNGAPLPIYKEDNGRVIAPTGFQTMAENVFADSTDFSLLKRQVAITSGYMKNLLQNVQERQLTPKRYFIAAQEQLLRILSLGITGFDTPTTLKGIEESAISLEGFKDTYQKSLSAIINQQSSDLHSNFVSKVDKAINYLKQHTDFNSFDRYEFIRDYFNPITQTWVTIRKSAGFNDFENYGPLNLDAPTFFEANSFNISSFLSANNSKIDSARYLTGKKLFYDPRLSAANNMSCASCHKPELAFTDGLEKAIGNHGGNLQRNVPTLINSVYNRSFFWDGRSGSLETQIAAVFTESKEFNTTVHELSLDVTELEDYDTLFKSLGKKPKSNNDLIMLISNYVSSLNGFNSKFDKNMRNEESTFTEEEQLGMQLFMGKALCATCHFVPLMNGTVPPTYLDSEKEVIGVPLQAANKDLDTLDVGFYALTKEDIHKGMFKTPTVRNAELTAPYMHNGVYSTLEQVMDFYNKGGGAGLGFEVPHQTLPFDSLQLNDTEVKAIIAFMKTLTDNPFEQEDYADQHAALMANQSFHE